MTYKILFFKKKYYQKIWTGIGPHMAATLAQSLPFLAREFGRVVRAPYLDASLQDHSLLPLRMAH
jgi:hypothetical protein